MDYPRFTILWLARDILNRLHGNPRKSSGNLENFFTYVLENKTMGISA
jgi:hypothetical protein